MTDSDLEQLAGAAKEYTFPHRPHDALREEIRKLKMRVLCLEIAVAPLIGMLVWWIFTLVHR